MSTAELLARADRLRSARTPFVLATVVRVERPTSAKAGDRALVLADGTLEGFVGGTCAESTVRLEGVRLLAAGGSELLRITPGEHDHDHVHEHGTTDHAAMEHAVSRTGEDGVVTVDNPCLSGGMLEIFLESMVPAALVHVFGDSPIARALADVGAAAGYDMRATTDPAEPIAADAAAVVVASHGRDETPVLTAALRAGVPYVGLVASRRRGAEVLAGLDVTDADRRRVHTPVGLDIGARTPADVAVSVLAQLISLRDREGDERVSIAGSPRERGAERAREPSHRHRDAP